MPPQSTTVPSSVAIAAPERGLGPVTASWVQVVPSHVHVSASRWLGASARNPERGEPPNSTILPPSVAAAAPPRGLGPATMAWVQLVPFHVHVSPYASSWIPPKSTTLPPSAAIATPQRDSSERRDWSGGAVQVLVAQDQMDVRFPYCSSPSNSTTWSPTVAAATALTPAGGLL